MIRSGAVLSRGLRKARRRFGEEDLMYCVTGIIFLYSQIRMEANIDYLLVRTKVSRNGNEFT